MLWQSIKVGSSKNRPSAAAKSAPEHPLMTPLPDNMTPFIGRELELAALKQRLAARDYRLISLVGPGGIGKSRLALEVARRNSHLFADGVYFVSLAPLQRPLEVPVAIATELELTFDDDDQSPQQQVLAALRSKQILLILDNLEHLLADKTANSSLLDLLLELLRHTPALTLLTTSRERLNIQAEDLHTLNGLPIPNADELATAEHFAAVRLFCDRAYRLQKSFELTKENVAQVVRICELVEGLPLGIELAATWIRDLDCAEIAYALESSLELLQTTLRDVAPQHRSMYAAFEHSWRLLTTQEQDVLSQLAVFRGSFSAAAAVEVVGATLLNLFRLRQKSLIREAGNGRYDIHGLLRRFALEKLDKNIAQAQFSRRCYSDYYLNFVAQRSLVLHGEAPQAALTEIRQELDNVRQAWQWSVENSQFAILHEGECITSLIQFYHSSGLSAEGEAAFEYALLCLQRTTEEYPAARQLHQKLMMALAQMSIVQSNFELAIIRSI